jgi:hypothetical protein
MLSKNYSVARVVQYTAADIGKSERHIERKNESYENMNVDLSRTPLNVHFRGCGELTYNARLDELVAAGAVSLRGLKKDAKVFDEMIFDVNTAYFEDHGGYEYAKRFYEEVFRFAEKEYGPGNIISAVMHADELNTALTEQLGHPVYHYHMHVVALPVVEKEIRWSKRCKDPALVGTVKEAIHQVSHSKKWASQKVTDENGHTQIVKSYSLLQDRFFEHMQEAGFRDFDRGERGSTAEHLSVIEYKTKKESERLAGYEEKQSEVQMEISALTVIKEDAQEQADAAHEQAERATEQANAAARRINELAPKLKNIEDFAREFSDDADKVLPEAGALESAKSYREKRAKPVYQKIVKVLRSLFNKYLDIKHLFERLTGDYNRLQQRYTSLDQAYERIKGENKELKTVADDYEALCRGFGREKIAASVQAIREQENAERMQRRSRRRHEIEVR